MAMDENGAMQWNGIGETEPLLFRFDRWVSVRVHSDLHLLVALIMSPVLVTLLLFDCFWIWRNPALINHNPVWEAVSTRFKQMPYPKEKTSQWGDGYLYGGARTRPDALGWRFCQRLEMGKSKLPEETEFVRQILEGQYDDEIVTTFYDAAASDWYYTKEKSWN